MMNRGGKTMPGSKPPRPRFYGQILFAHVDDGRGHSKPHPVVIVAPDDEIVLGEPIRVVCVSTQVEDPCPSHGSNLSDRPFYFG